MTEQQLSAAPADLRAHYPLEDENTRRARARASGIEVSAWWALAHLVQARASGCILWRDIARALVAHDVRMRMRHVPQTFAQWARDKWVTIGVNCIIARDPLVIRSREVADAVIDGRVLFALFEACHRGSDATHSPIHVETLTLLVNPATSPDVSDACDRLARRGLVIYTCDGGRGGRATSHAMLTDAGRVLAKSFWIELGYERYLNRQ